MAKKVHFIGIGGIGVSALAQYFLAKKDEVSGSDLVSSEIVEMLEKKGAKIIINPNVRKLPESLKKLIKKSDLVIYSQAVLPTHPEIKFAKKLKIKCLSYPEALGQLTKKNFTIAVCGTHGKSTTTAMISLILVKAKKNPTVILGTKLKEFGNSNFRMGKKFLVIEADEWHESFLNYYPDIIVLTNIEREHLDYYKNLKNLLKGFEKFIARLPENGILIINDDDKNIKKLKIKKKKLKILKFSFRQKERKIIKKILKIPGRHNVYNALAALTCAKALKIPDRISLKALGEYQGSWRRMEEKIVRIKNSSVILISDYGHHPTEIEATISAINEKYPRKKVWLIFQPHQYQRTYYLFKDFVRVLKKIKVEKIIIPPIYDVAGRERADIKKKVSSEKLIQAINKKLKKARAIFLPDFEKIKSFIEAYFDGDILVIMGAGNIYNLWKDFSS